jgi:hypothetical protein
VTARSIRSRLSSTADDVVKFRGGGFRLLRVHNAPSPLSPWQTEQLPA